jgi:hypothetical protein
MTILLAVTLAAAIQPTCSWDRPGQNPYKGTQADAIDRYTDIPENVRITLKSRMEDGLSDDKVSITRDGIIGHNKYSPEIRDMHFGSASVCSTVTREKWAADRIEPGIVYCVGKHCILVPKICGNVSRITRNGPAVAAAPAPKPPKETGVLEYSAIDLEDAPRLSDAIPLNEFTEKPIRPRLASATPPGGAWGYPRDRDEPLNPYHPMPPNSTPGNPGIPAAVPEPETWGMMLGGLGLVGWFARRRARAAANAT